MSTTAFLNTLRKYDLQQYYPNFSSKGVLTLEYLADLSMQNYSKLGVQSINDKRKFMELANELKLQKQKQQQQQQQKQQKLQSKDKSPLIISEQPKKRLATNLPSPDRKNRRLTIGPHPTQQMHQQYQRQPLAIPTSRNNNDSLPISNRRLSYIPSKQNQSNTSPNSYNNNSSLQRSSPTKTSTARYTSKQSAHPLPLPPSLDDFHVNEKKKPIIPVQLPERHLDAYGIPKLNPRRRLSIDGISSGINNKSFFNTSMHINSSINKLSVPNFSSSSASLSTSSKILNNAQHLSNELQQRIRVCVRKRPLSKKELSSGENDISQIVGPHTIQLNAPKTRVDLTRYTEQHTFTYDEVFDSNSSNIEIYHRTARPLVNYVFNGGKATCFAFGQTGSGKTYTMLDPNHGLYIMAAKDIFAMLEKPQYSNLGASVGFYEIYQGKLYDLLNQRKQLIPRDDGNSNVVIAGLREYPISDLDRLMQIFDFGSRSRTTGKTGANDNSSRSHAVLQVLLKENESDVIYGKLSFIDLAGSERGVDRGDANPKTRLEGAEINKSLLALKECIRALDQDKKHTPFRGSKLTQVLRDSFVGDSRTCMIATISPNHSNSEHTLNTLRYADRVKELKGESDPRLQTDQYLEMNQLEGFISVDQQRNSNNSNNSQQNDSQSVTTSEAYWDDEITENIMDVDFPADAIASGAMGTPRSQRVWGGSTTPHRREKYLRRLSSPPEELFQQPAEDPFMSETTKSSKLTPNKNNTDNIENNNTNDEEDNKYKNKDIKKKRLYLILMINNRMIKLVKVKLMTIMTMIIMVTIIVKVSVILTIWIIITN
ncbi:unnamed protein product [Cunninghamella blakesleeana]